MNVEPKPSPKPSADALPYWEAAKRHEFVLPFCNSCKKFFFYPRPFCPRDFSWDIEWRPASGKGTLHAFTILHRPLQPGFEAPYVVALIEVEDGARVMTNLVGVEPDPEKIEIGMSVEVTFEDRGEDTVVPQFRPIER